MLYNEKIRLSKLQWKFERYEVHRAQQTEKYITVLFWGKRLSLSKPLPPHDFGII